MNINLQKILFGFLFLFLIIAVIINNSKLQQTIITNYFNKATIEDYKNFELENFEFDVMGGNLRTDLLLLDTHTLDTLINLHALSFNLSLFDIFFAKSIEIDKIILNSPKFIISQNSNNNKKSLFNILSKFNSFSREIFISEIKFRDITFSNHSSKSIDVLDLKDITINQNNFSVKDILFKTDSSFIQTSCLYQDSVLFYTVENSSINFENNILNSYIPSIYDSVFKENTIIFSGAGKFY